MATIRIRDGFIYAQYSDSNCKTIRKSTGIRVPDGYKPKFNKQGKRIYTKLESEALDIAKTWERVAKGQMEHEIAQAYLIAAAKVKPITSPLAVEWLSEYQPRGGAQNQKNVKHAIRLFLDFLAKNEKKDIRMADIKRQHCSQFLGEQLRDRGLASSTALGYRNHLARAFKVCIETFELQMLNPFAITKMADVRLEYVPERKGSDKTKRLPFTLEELSIIFNSFPETYSTLAKLSFFLGGQRIGDCIHMEWGQVDFKRGLITCRTQKTGRELVHPIVDTLRQCLMTRHQNCESLNSPYIFPELVELAKGSKGAISTRFTTLLIANGIDTQPQHLFANGKRRIVSVKSFHSLRHSAVTLMRAGGIPAELSRAVVGHDSEAIERVYFTPDIKHKANALSTLEKAVQASTFDNEK